MNAVSRLLSAAIIASTLLSAACGGNGQAAGPAFGQAEAQSVRDRSQALTAAVNAKNIDQILAFYPGDSILMPPQAPTARGKDAIRGFYEDLLTQNVEELRTETTDVGGAGELAYETGTYSMNRRPADGPSTRDRGKYVFVWRHRGGQWLIDYTIWSSDLPQPVQIASR